jgi:WD40 repeat protein
MSKALLKERNLDIDEFTGNNMRQKDTKIDIKNSNVLVAPMSTLVDVCINERDPQYFLVTIDSENLLRAWNMKNCSTQFSYSISQLGARVTAAAIDGDSKHLAVGNTKGEVMVLNLKSGDTLYTLPHADSEISNLKFVRS